MQVEKLRSITDDVLEITFACAQGESLPDYLPGQQLSIVLPGVDGETTTRNYSLVGPARIQDRKNYRIAVRHQTGVDENCQPWQGEVSSDLQEQLSGRDIVQIDGSNGLCG